MGWYRRWADQDPAWPALVEDGRTVTYGQLAELEVGPPDRRVVDTEGVAWVVDLLAALNAGAEAVLPDPAWSPSDRRATLATLPPSETVDEPGMWLFTSGTTARPKPRFRSVTAVRTMVERVRARLPSGVAEGRPPTLAMVPLNHGFGLLNALLLGHRVGGTVHLAPGDDPEHASQLIWEHGIGVLFAWPAQFESLAERGAWPTGATSLRWCVSSSRGLARDVAERFEARTGCPVRQQYGTTETGPLSVDGDDRPEPACVGTALDGIDLRVVDDRGGEQAPGEEGRVAVGPDDSFSSQLEREADGLYYPGDLGRKDAPAGCS